MSTRCTITVYDRKGANESYSVYRHSDGYPDGQHGVPATLGKALAYAWPLPRFEASDFSAAIVAAWKTGNGDIRLSSGRDEYGDTEFHYDVYPVRDSKEPVFMGMNVSKIAVECFSDVGTGSKHVWKRFGKTTYLTAKDRVKA